MNKLGGHRFDFKMQLLFCQGKIKKKKPKNKHRKSIMSRIFSKQLAKKAKKNMTGP